MTTDHRIYADVTRLGRMQADLRNTDSDALRDVAKQFESLFTNMLMKSMRATSFGDSIFSSQQSEFYRDMHDQQLSVQLSRGAGLGLAELLVRQFGGEQLRKPEPSLVPVGPALPVAGKPAVQRTEPDTDWLPKDPVSFVRDLWPHAKSAAKALGVAPHLVIAQAALETGWGRFPIRAADGTNSLNLFGIKAGGSWAGPSATVPTMEVESGAARRRHAAFRVYDTIADSVRDYAQLLGNNARYRGVLGSGADALEFGAALLRGGYATDPDYAGKLERIVGGSTLRRAFETLKLDAKLPIN